MPGVEYETAFEILSGCSWDAPEMDPASSSFRPGFDVIIDKPRRGLVS